MGGERDISLERGSHDGSVLTCDRELAALRRPEWDSQPPRP